MQKEGKSGKGGACSRRDFGRGAVLVLAGAAVGPAKLLSLGEAAPPSAAQAAQQVQPATNLSPQAAAEIDVKMQNILRRWGDRLSEDQRTRVRSTLTRHVRMLEAVRAYPLENGDCPAPVLKLIEARSVPTGTTQTPSKTRVVGKSARR